MSDRVKVGEILIRAGVIDEMQLRAALGNQAHWGGRLGITLVKMGMLEERDLIRALAQQLQLPVIQLEGKRVQREVLDLVPVELAEKHLCVPLFVRDEGGTRTLFVGMDDPGNLEVIDALRFRTGMKVQPVLVSPSELFEAIDRFYHRSEDGVLTLEEEAASGPVAGIDAVPEIQESLFRDVSELASSSSQAEAEADAAPAQEAGTALPADPGPAVAAPASGHAGTNAAFGGERLILRALCQLLIEKGVITREELRERVSGLQQP